MRLGIRFVVGQPYSAGRRGTTAASGGRASARPEDRTAVAAPSARVVCVATRYATLILRRTNEINDIIVTSLIRAQDLRYELLRETEFKFRGRTELSFKNDPSSSW